MIPNIFINIFLIINLFIAGNPNNLKNVFQNNVPVKFSPAGINYLPAISPDHKYISFLYDEKNEKGEPEYVKIWLYDISKSKMMKICDLDLLYGSDDTPVWSNDSKTLYFSANDKIYKLDIDNMRIDSIYWANDEKISLLAPSLTHDGKKLAFYAWIDTLGNIYNSIWVLDLNSRMIVKSPKVEFAPGTEVIFTKPQWYHDDSKIATVFFPSYSETSIYLFDLKNFTEKKIIKGIAYPFFRMKNELIYFSKYFKPAVRLCSFNLKTLMLNKIFEINDNRFDIIEVKDSVKIIYDDQGNLLLYSNGKVTDLNIEGINPVYSDPYLIFERFTRSESDSLGNDLYLVKDIEF